MPPNITLKNRAGLAQMAPKAFIEIIAPEIHAAAQASRECGQANADTNIQAPSAMLR